ncbi:MAG: hypothetical protein FWB76_01850 [Oscillospiraceae bacterium]|nr:hypothetical protein [Oscillospiraceae bacterium]
MSMPSFPPKDSLLSRDEAIDAILTSIAMEEAALSHVLNAEGEKLQLAVAYAKTNKSCETMRELLEMNNSVSHLIEQVNDMQFLLKSKIKLVSKFAQPWPKPPCSSNPCPVKPCPVNPCPARPCNDCTAEFAVACGLCWRNELLSLQDKSCCKSNIKLDSSGKKICLPGGKAYAIGVDLKLDNGARRPILIEFLLVTGNEVTSRKKLTVDDARQEILLLDFFEWEVPASHDKSELFIQLSPNEGIKVNYGKITVKEINC